MVLHEWPEPPREESHLGHWPLRMAKALGCATLHLAAGRGANFEDYFRDRIFKQLGLVVVHSVEFRERLLAIGLRPDQVLFRMHPTFPAVRPSMDCARVDERFGLDGRRVMLIFGFPDPRKGFESALNTLTSLPEDVTLVWAGGCRGPSDRNAIDSLETSASRLGVGERFVVAGYLEGPDLAALMMRTTIALAPFRDVTGSGSIGRFLSSGLPIVASDLCSIRELAKAGAGIELVTPEDFDGLVVGIQSLLDDAPRRAELSRRSLDFASWHSFDALAAELVAALEGFSSSEIR